MIEINKSKVRKMLYEFNQLAKTVYDSYTYSNYIALPYNRSSVKNPELFSNSILVSKEIDLPFMNDTVVDPVSLNNAIKDTKLKGYDKKDDIYYLISDTDKYTVSRDIYDNEVNKESSLLDIINPADYENEYILNSSDINSLLGYNSTSLTIGNCNGKDIGLICTLKIFPAIKKADKIVIYSKKYDKNVYQILIYSFGSTWSFYSVHYILNF